MDGRAANPWICMSQAEQFGSCATKYATVQICVNVQYHIDRKRAKLIQIRWNFTPHCSTTVISETLCIRSCKNPLSSFANSRLITCKVQEPKTCGATEGATKIWVVSGEDVTNYNCQNGPSFLTWRHNLGQNHFHLFLSHIGPIIDWIKCKIFQGEWICPRAVV